MKFFNSLLLMSGLAVSAVQAFEGFDIGLLVRDETPKDQLAKRGIMPGKRSLMVPMEHLFDERGEMFTPKSFDDAEQLARRGPADYNKNGGRHSRRGGSGYGSGNIRVTYYNEPSDLAHPACEDWRKAGHFTPGDSNLVAAVTVDNHWTVEDGKPECEDFIRIDANGNAVVARVVDACAGDGCAVDGNRTVDLTLAAFLRLAKKEIGVLNGVQVRKVSKPGKPDVWTKSDIAKYGPQHL